MTSTDASAALLEVLAQYFSPPIARALLTSTLRRAKLETATLTPQSMRDAVRVLEQSLPMYLGDASRSSDCVSRLRKLVPSTPAPAASSPPVPSAGARLGPAKAVATASTVIQVASADDVANACEVGRDIARRVGFPQVVQTKIATAIAELARNILLYVGKGEVHIAAIDQPRRGVEITAEDHGSGIADLDLVLNGNYRSKTGMGMGLRGAKRLMDAFDIASSPQGTRVVVRKYLT